MKQKVLLGLSGGVDSAVAAMLLQKQGYVVIGAFLRCFSASKNKITGECNYLEDKNSAQKIASILNIKFIELDYEKKYTKSVIKPMFESYSRGLTPNPDSLCNKTIKFPYLWKEAKKNGCEFIATGHYIKKVKRGNKYYLQIPKDKSKDQSYFLYGLNQKDLGHTLFPIGDFTKKEVRSIAKKNNFPNYDKHGTRGLCFVGNINMKSFLKQKIRNKSGLIRNPEGQIVGKHDGIMFYTIGERVRENENVTINNKYKNQVKSKLYISKKDIKKNELIIAPNGHPILLRKEFFLKNVNWISKSPSGLLDAQSVLSRYTLTWDKPKQTNLLVRIRHLGELHEAIVKKEKNKIKISLNNPIGGIAPGQSAVLYTKQRIMLGGGEIAY